MNLHAPDPNNPDPHNPDPHTPDPHTPGPSANDPVASNPDANNSDAIDIEDIRSAAVRLGSDVVRTPCVYNEVLSSELNCHVYFKAENLQHIGAFKARGALNAVRQLSDQQAAHGVVTHSSGNHAAALARAAKLRGIQAHVVMPRNSAESKIQAVRRLGVEPVFCEPDTPSRVQCAEEIRKRTNATLVHPFNDPHVMAGQGTVALEILEQVPQVQSIVAPVGGGGLLSGILTAVKSINPEVAVFGAEPEWADDAFRSLQSKTIEAPVRYDSIADGLRSSLGDLTFPILRDKVDEILLASELDILRWTRAISERAKLVCEPSGAVATAAVAGHRHRFSGQHVVVVVSGGNIDFGNCRLGN